VERDVVPTGVERAEAIEQRLGEVDPFDPQTSLRERERVPPHPAADIEDPFALHEPGEADELIDLPLDIGRWRWPHRPLAGTLEVLDLRPVVLLDAQLGVVVLPAVATHEQPSTTYSFLATTIVLAARFLARTA
jgi:hypothetical protein